MFVDKDGKDQEVRAPLGKNLLEVAHDNEIDLEGRGYLLPELLISPFSALCKLTL